MVNIDAINPNWPHPIHLPDEEETLDKQASSGAVAARERGLVPQSGDWEHPYRWVTPEEVEEIKATEQLSTSTLVEGYVQDTETGRTKIVPRKSKAEGGGPPTHLYRVMDKRQYDDAVKEGKLKPAPDGDRRIYAAGKPSFQYAEPSPTVLVAIEYSDDDGWKAQSGLSEVTATTENPIPISKVKVIVEGANKRELLANYDLVSDKIFTESKSYETVDLDYARENLSPFSVRNNKGTNAKKQLEDILDSDVESVTVWHGTTLGGAKKILEDGMIRGYGGFGAGVTLDPYRAYTYTRGQKSAYDLPDKDKYPVVMQFEIPKDMFKNFTPEVGGLGKDELLFNPWGAATYRSESFVSLPDEYKNSGGEFPSYKGEVIPLTIDDDSVKFITSEDVDIPAPEITKQAVEFRDFTSSPPDETVASRMKARGLEWKKETHRWVRPEDAEEEEQKIHSLSGNRDEFFDALMERFLDKRMSTEELTDAEKEYFSHIKKAFDSDIDRAFWVLKRNVEYDEEDPNFNELENSILTTLRERFPARQYYAQLKVDALNAIRDSDSEFMIGPEAGDFKEVNNLLIRPYILSQTGELGQHIKEMVSDRGKNTNHKELHDRTKRMLGPLNGFIQEASASVDGLQPQDLVSLYTDGVLDINGMFNRKSLNDSLIYSMDNFISRDELDKVLQFSRDNLFKLVSSGDRIGVNNIVSKIYDSSSPSDKKFMREALLNSFKDEELVSHIHIDFVSWGNLGNYNVTSETKDVLAGINHLTLAIYEDMLKNGDIDDLAKFFSDDNIPTGVLNTPEYSGLPFHFLSEHVSVDDFDSHVDTFLNSGQILRKAGIEALSFIDPNHPSLLAMAETEDNPFIMNHLANNLPVTALEDLSTRTQDMWESIDTEKLQSDAWREYAEKHGIDYERIVSPDDEEYDEYREQRGEMRAYGEKAVVLMRHSRRELENTKMKAQDRLNILKDVSFDIGSIESFHSILKKQPSTDTTEQAYLPGMEPGDDYEPKIESGQYQPLFNEWANNLPDEFVGILEKGFSEYYDENPGLPKLFDELYYGTLFGKIHTFSKGAWEGSSSSPWGGILKESVARQLDDKVIFHSERITRPSIDEVLERERNNTFIPDKINSANFNQENLDTYVRMHKNLTRALLDVVIPDSDTIEVFRGSSSNELSSEDLNTLSSDDFSSANIESNSLSSYSLNESTATQHFAEGKDDGIVINIPELHKDNIWSTFLSHSYQGNEREILVINHSDMDAYAKSTEQAIDTDQFNPDFLDSSSIDDIYGISGYTDNDYIDEFGNVSALEKHILEEIASGNNSYLEDYMNSPHYDSYMVQEWAAAAAQQIMDWSEENYDYTLDISAEQESAIDIVENFGFLGRITHPEHVLDNYPASEGYENLAKNIFDKQKQLWEEGGSTHVAVMNEGDEEELANESDRIAIELMEWAEQGQAKVSGI